MKAANSYASLLRGVSQQVPQDRAEGQHNEQVNMLSDPVNGLVRRHGSIWQAEQLVPVAPDDLEAALADTNSWVSYDFDTGGKEHSVLYRTAAKPTGSSLPLMYVYSKTDKVWLDLVHNPADTGLSNTVVGGVSALTSVGKYLFFAGNTTTATAAITDVWGSAANRQAVAWVRGGAYSRTFTVTVKTAFNTLTRSYTTPAASYSGVLDTSDILTTDSDYTKKVNDRVNAYNAAVTQWIGTSAAAIQPEAIAASLSAAFSGSGLSFFRNGSHICFESGVLSVEVSDGGDNTLIRGVATEIESIDTTSVIHANGHVVKVRGKNSAEAFYLKAVSKVDGAVAGVFTEVRWVEAAGVGQAITGGLCYATIVGTTIYMASSADLLGGLTPGPHPAFASAMVGDLDTQPTPSFVGKTIDYLGTFQNRLVVGSGAVLSLSKTEDYLNFFRSTVLTVPADDPFELLAQGSEDDTIRHSVLYNRNLVLFGRKRQYAIQGSIVVTPTSANLSVITNYEGVADAAPVASGSFLFYAKRGEGFSSIYQIQPGQVENTPESFPASSQLDSYLGGGIIELASATGSPSYVFLRTTGARESIHVFTYLDKQDGRKLDSWSRWDFNSALGPIIGMSVVVDGLLVYHLREGTSGTAVFTVADFVPLDTLLSKRPYLDSNRSLQTLSTPNHSVSSGNFDEWVIALGAATPKRFNGTGLANLSTFVNQYPSEPDKIVGARQSAYFSPTNPYMRDNKEKAILSGRLTITKKVLAFKESSGFSWTVSYRNAVVSAAEFSGRILGDPTNAIGREPISTGQFSIPIGRESRQYQLTVFARKWLPLTITGLEWVGQWFNRVQRF